jgi:hypothetical protein
MRQKRSRDREVRERGGVERPLQLGRACFEQRGGRDVVAHRGHHGVRGPDLFGDSPAQERGLALVAEVPDEGVQAAQPAFVNVLAQVLAQTAELLPERDGAATLAPRSRSARTTKGPTLPVAPATTTV